MANDEHLALLRQGEAVWDAWREKNAPGHARKRSCHPDVKRVVQDETGRY
jgi:hypothetical protein